jgi:hypothetical protein
MEYSMSVPTGNEAFHDYLSIFSFEDVDKPDKFATDDELYKHFDEYLQQTFAAQYPATVLEKITVSAGDAFDIEKVRALL